MTTETVRSDRSSTTPAERLQATMAAVRVAFTWFGIRKTLTSSQKAQAAETFGTEEDCLAASKKLLDTRAEACKAVTSIRNRIRALWWGMSLPYPDPGVRLIRQDQVDAFNDQTTRMRRELAEAVEGLDAQLPELKQAARQRLGNLREFFERFRMLNVRSSADLEDLVQTAQRALKGAGPQGLRDDGHLRAHIATQLSGIQASLDGLLVDQPRRRVLRPPERCPGRRAQVARRASPPSAPGPEIIPSKSRSVCLPWRPFCSED
jgi:hypothetical protein